MLKEKFYFHSSKENLYCVFINQSELEISETENKKLRLELEQMRTHYDSDMEALKKRNDSLLEDCERYREVSWLSFLMQGNFPAL